MIRLVLTMWLIALTVATPAAADIRSLYTVRDIPVDETASSVIEAQQRAFEAARLEGAQEMLERITLDSDREVAGGIFVDQDLANRLAAAVDVQEEVRGGGRYRGVLAVVFNPRNVRAYLNDRGIPFVDQQAPFSLAIPVVYDGVVVEAEPIVLEDGTEIFDETSLWLNAWGPRNEGVLTHYATTEFAYDPDATWIDAQEDALAVGARRAFVTILLGGPGAYFVDIFTLTPAGRAPLATTDAVPTIADAVKAATQLLDEAWKEQSVIRSKTRTLAEASVFYTSLAEWNTLRGALSRSPLISSFRIDALARDGAVVSFAFAGDERRLMIDLRQRGVMLDTDPGGWVLTSAVTLGEPITPIGGEVVDFQQ